MKVKGRPSSPNFDNRLGPYSPDERQEINDKAYLSGILFEINSRDAPPFPRFDPRKKAPGLHGMTYGEFDQQLSEEGAINRYTEDLTRADYLRWPLGYNDANDYSKRHGHQYRDAAEFLLDTFKRAREVGYPIHPLAPYLHTMASSTFSDQGYESKAK